MDTLLTHRCKRIPEPIHHSSKVNHNDIRNVKINIFSHLIFIINLNLNLSHEFHLNHKRAILLSPITLTLVVFIIAIAIITVILRIDHHRRTTIS